MKQKTAERFFLRILLSISVWGVLCVVHAQTPLAVEGKVVDSESGEPLPFVQIYIPHTTQGTLSNDSGLFFIRTRPTDTLSFRLVGYEEYKTTAMRLASSLPTTIVMVPQVQSLHEIRVKPNNEALKLIQQMIKAKPRNNPNRHARADYEKYSRWDYALHNVSDQMSQSWLLKGAQSWMQSDGDSNRHLPVYFSEQITRNQTQQQPRLQKSIIIADRTNGLNILKDYEIGGYTSALDMEINFYENLITFLEQSFISPLADNAPFYYKYYLTDSLQTPQGKSYTLRFVPRREGDKTFSGTLTTETRFYSIQQIDATLSGSSNINFIKKLHIQSRYQLVHDSLPFYQWNQLEAAIDYMPVQSNQKRLQIAYRLTNSVGQVTFDHTTPIELSNPSASYETVHASLSRQKDTTYWHSHRHQPLTAADLQTIQSIDSLNRLKPVQFVDRTARMTITGYFDLGKFEIGPYMEMLNFNKVEGARLYLGGRTSKEISERWQVWGGIGMGTKQGNLAGNAGAGYRFNAPTRSVVKASFSEKVIRIGESEKILYLYENMTTTSESNLVALLLQREAMDELVHERKIKLDVEHEWRLGLESRLKVFYARQYSPVYYPFTQNGGTTALPYIEQVEWALDTRWSNKEKFTEDGLQRIYLTTPKPIVHFTLAGGVARVDQQNHWYARIHTTLKHKFFIGLGEVRYAVEGGMIWGKLPYSMLEIPRGNKTYGLYTFDFNLLNYLEFAHDQYLYTYADYYLNGFFFNRIPLLNKLGLREVIGFKAMAGQTGNQHAGVMDFATNLRPLNGCYLELNAGVDNIFRFFRVDGIWRITPGSITGAPMVGVRAQFKLKL